MHTETGLRARTFHRLPRHKRTPIDDSPSRTNALLHQHTLKFCRSQAIDCQRDGHQSRKVPWFDSTAKLSDILFSMIRLTLSLSLWYVPPTEDLKSVFCYTAEKSTIKRIYTAAFRLLDGYDQFFCSDPLLRRKTTYGSSTAIPSTSCAEIPFLVFRMWSLPKSSSC